MYLTKYRCLTLLSSEMEMAFKSVICSKCSPTEDLWCSFIDSVEGSKTISCWKWSNLQIPGNYIVLNWINFCSCQFTNILVRYTAAEFDSVFLYATWTTCYVLSPIVINCILMDDTSNVFLQAPNACGVYRFGIIGPWTPTGEIQFFK